jgi:hypothetical protein
MPARGRHFLVFALLFTLFALPGFAQEAAGRLDGRGLDSRGQPVIDAWWSPPPEIHRSRLDCYGSEHRR